MKKFDSCFYKGESNKIASRILEFNNLWDKTTIDKDKKTAENSV